MPKRKDTIQYMVMIKYHRKRGLQKILYESINGGNWKPPAVLRRTSAFACLYRCETFNYRKAERVTGKIFLRDIWIPGIIAGRKFEDMTSESKLGRTANERFLNIERAKRLDEFLEAMNELKIKEGEFCTSRVFSF